jgi:hypothetical protein
MGFLSFIPFFRTRRAKTIKIRRVRRARPTLFIKFHIAVALALLGLATCASMLLGVVGGAAILSEPRTVVSPALLAVLLSAHAYTVMFALNRNSH